MTISGIALDKWAEGGGLLHSNIIIVSICFLVSFCLFIIRSLQVWLRNSDNTVHMHYPQKTLQACHLLAMLMSCLYMALNIWNYFNVYIERNAMNCSLWFTLSMISLTMTKIFIYSFLMLRSSLAFRNGIFKIPLKISTSITIFSVTAQLSMMTVTLSDFTTFSLRRNNTFCFRRFGPIGTFGIAGFNISAGISAFIAFIVFWSKSKFVKSKVLNDADLNTVFNKHIKLGMLIVLGSILIFFAGEFLTVLMDVACSLQQCLDNIYLFLLFKENKKVYNMFCKCGHGFDRSLRNVSRSELKLVELVVEAESDVKMMQLQSQTCHEKKDSGSGMKTVAIAGSTSITSYRDRPHISYLSKSFSKMPQRCKLTPIHLTLFDYHTQ